MCERYVGTRDTANLARFDHGEREDSRQARVSTPSGSKGLLEFRSAAYRIRFVYLFSMLARIVWM